jgi:hypothetical protein
MTVRDLIEALKGFDQNLPVRAEAYRGPWCSPDGTWYKPVTSVRLTKGLVKDLYPEGRAVTVATYASL